MTADFGFAFNDKRFSDRVLHLQIITKDSTLHTQTDAKRTFFSRSTTKISSVELGGNVESLHISTPILAANSPFFYKFFKNKLKESALTLMINSSEEQAALIDVLSFIYKNSLKATKSSDLLAVLMAAHKFQVACCMQYCIQALLKLPISLELAMLYINLPPSLVENETVQPLIDASNEVVATGYMDFTTESQEKAMELPLSAIEFILRRDGLRVNSEDEVFNFVLKWARAHYPNMNESKEILTKRLWPLVNFQYMSWLMLKQVLACAEFEQKHASQLVSEALLAKDEMPYSQHLHPPKGSLARRAYLRPLVKVVQLDFPQPRCVVYLSLKRDECANLFPSNRLYSQHFELGGQSLLLFVLCKVEEPHTFGSYLCRPKGSNTSIVVDYEFAVMSKTSDEFSCKRAAKKQTVGEQGRGFQDLLQISWAKFMSEDCEFFIDGIIHLQVKITLNNSH